MSISKLENFEKIKETYGKNSLGNKPAFPGLYINFGYWDKILTSDKITFMDKIKASQQLYNYVFDRLNITSDDTVLEIGCGVGYGCILAKKQYKPKEIIGVDIVAEQIQRAKVLYKILFNNYPTENDSVQFREAPAYSIELPNNYFTKIYSIETIQYIFSIASLVNEMNRVLKSGGKLIITAHLATSSSGLKKLRKLIPTAEENIDKLLPIQGFIKEFEKKGLKLSQCETIGNYVFESFDRWTLKINDAWWKSNILKAYKEKLLDYYFLILDK